MVIATRGVWMAVDVRAELASVDTDPVVCTRLFITFIHAEMKWLRLPAYNPGTFH